MSARDDGVEESVLLQRAHRASKNLQESLPVFMALVLLAMVMKVDVSMYACWWLILRVAHGGTYLVGVPYIRTIAFIGSIYCLIMMGVCLV
jgi:Predicted membrane protein